MKIRRLGAEGPSLTTVGFGAWAIGGPWRFGWGAVDDGESVQAIRRAIALGVNWVDTAAVYGLGHSEEVVREALEPYRPGEDVFVLTKCGRRWQGRPDGVIENDLKPASIREECDDSLRRLGVERIDLLQAHWPDWTTGTPIEESWGTMSELVDEGKVRWLGASNFDEELLDRCEAVRHVDAIQSPLSLLARGARHTSVRWAAQHDAGAICYSPMASGLLTGAFDHARVEGLSATDWRAGSPAFQEPLLTQTLSLVERLRQIAARLAVSVPELVVAWVVAQPGVTGAIVGARSPRHVEGWVGAADLELDEAVLAEIDAAIEATGAGSDAPPAPPPHIRAVSA